MARGGRLTGVSRSPHSSTRSAGSTAPAAPRALLDLQRRAGNAAVTSLVQRQVTRNRTPMDPRNFSDFGGWLGALPSNATDDTAVNETGQIATQLPDLASLVVDLRADCADVTILLKHYYYEAHGKTIKIPRGQEGTTKRFFEIGSGVTRKTLRMALVNLGTVHFHDMRKSHRIVDYYGGRKPLKNLKQILDAGLTAGDVLVWKKARGVRGRFSGHIHTVQDVVHRGAGYDIEVLQGTLESGKAVGEIQTKRLTSLLLTGKSDGDGPITYRPGGEVDFYGAGKWFEKSGDAWRTLSAPV